MRRLRFLTKKLQSWKDKLRADDWYFIAATPEDKNSTEYKDKLIEYKVLQKKYQTECSDIIQEQKHIIGILNKNNII